MPDRAAQPQSDRTDTRELLVESAERLFAAHGIDGVSMRRINREAGQLNTSSIHYYFGSRAAVIEAVVERRMSAINRQRLAMLEASPDAPDAALADLVACYVRPLADLCAAGGGAYVRFLAEAYASAEVEIALIARGKWDQSLVQVTERIRGMLPALPEPVFRARMAIFFRGVVYALADREREALGGRGGRGRLGDDAFVADLIAVQAAGLNARHVD